MGDPWRPDPKVVAKVDAAMATIRQGDVIAPGTHAWIADRDHPLTAQTAELGGSGPGSTSAETAMIAIVSQTCDIVRNCWDPDPEATVWPFVQVSPVVVLTGPAQGEAAGGHSTRFAPLPALGDDHFADLTICTTLEKSVLLGMATPVHGCVDDKQREAFAAAVARNRSRFAFPDGMEKVLKPLRRRIRDKRNKDSPEARRIADVMEIRVRRDDHTEWDSPLVEVELIFIVDPDKLPPTHDEEAPGPSPDVEQWASTHNKIHELAAKIESVGDPADITFLWQRLVEAWRLHCATDPHVVITGASAESAAEYSVAQARLEPKLDLDHLSHL